MNLSVSDAEQHQEVVQGSTGEGLESEGEEGTQPFGIMYTSLVKRLCQITLIYLAGRSACGLLIKGSSLCFTMTC
eukprot:2265260-Amphidinium_carterae.1